MTNTYYPISRVGCPAANFALLDSVASINCAYIAQARKKLVGSDSNNGACLFMGEFDADAAAHFYRAALFPCDSLDARTQFILNPTTGQLEDAADEFTPSPSGELFARTCKITASGSGTFNQPVFGWASCSIAEFNTQTQCAFGCPEDSVTAITAPDSSAFDQLSFDNVTLSNPDDTGDTSTLFYHIKSGGGGDLCIRYDSTSDNDVIYGSCVDDSATPLTNDAYQGSTWRLLMVPTKKCHITCATGYAYNTTLVTESTGFTVGTQSSFMSCPAATTAEDGVWDIEAVCGNCAPGYSRGTPTGPCEDLTTEDPTLTDPAASDSTNTISVNFTLPEAASAGTVTLTFAGTATVTVTFASAFETAGTHTVTLDGTDLDGVAEVASTTSQTLATDTYTVTLSYRDSLGNTAATDSSANWAYDGETLAPTLTTPADSASDGIQFDVNFTLPEAPLAGSVKLTFERTDAAETDIVLTLSSAVESQGVHAFTLDAADLSAASDSNIASNDAGATRLSGGATYTVTISYQDTFSNTAATDSATNVL